MGTNANYCLAAVSAEVRRVHDLNRADDQEVELLVCQVLRRAFGELRRLSQAMSEGVI